jgi:flagellar biosynthetic protein FlhB
VSAAEKQLPATQKRREAALAKGDSPRSREVPAAATLAVGLVALVAGGEALFSGLSSSLAAALRIAPASVTAWQPVAAVVVMDAARPLVALCTLSFVVALAAQFTAPVRFDWSSAFGRWSRLSPISGVKRLVGTDALIELLRAVVKTFLLVGIGVAAVVSMVGTSDPLAALVRLLFACAAVIVLTAAADVPLQRFRWLARNRMSFDELREETKESEGAPEMRAARRVRQRAQASRSVAGALAGAQAVLVNPSEFAVVLRYVAGRDAAPVVAFKGRGVVAAAIRDAASARDIPVLRYPGLTRAIYFTARVGSEIDSRLYLAVAQILSFVLNIDRSLARQPEVDVPQDFRFDSDGRKVGATAPFIDP